MSRKVVGPKRRQKAVLRVLLLSEGFAFPGLMDDSTGGAATKGTSPIAHAEMPEPLASRAHSKALSR